MKKGKKKRRKMRVKGFKEEEGIKISSGLPEEINIERTNMVILWGNRRRKIEASTSIKHLYYPYA